MQIQSHLRRASSISQDAYLPLQKRAELPHQHCPTVHCSTFMPTEQQQIIQCRASSTDSFPLTFFADMVNVGASCSAQTFGKGRHLTKTHVPSFLPVLCHSALVSGPRMLLTHPRKGTNTKKKKKKGSLPSLQPPSLSPERMDHHYKT